MNKPKETSIVCTELNGFTCDLDGTYCVLFNGVRCNPRTKKKELRCKQ